MNILLVYPTYPDTFWSFRHALKFVSKKASFPPLGLLTVAALLPPEWKRTLVDMNVEALTDAAIRSADYVFLSAMSVQSASADDVIRRCKELGTAVVAGGPHFTSSPEQYPEVDHLVLDEAENTLPRFCHDVASGHPQHLYRAEDWADIETTPVPQWDLISHKHYSSMNIQYSRGCPFDCDFCDITVLYGRKPRTKTRAQVLAELDALYATGWKGPLFFVDDNFIGNKAKLKRDILPSIADWMQNHRHPFYLNTEASINLADDTELMHLMGEAGFEAVFVGIETPNEASLASCGKIVNGNRDLISSVRQIQRAGMEVQGGFIVGFDEDPPSIFARLTEFIQESGIVTAMVGLLNAPKGTRLYKRLHDEGRLLSDFNGNNTDFATNFVPRMDEESLLSGYRTVLDSIYAPRNYYARVRRFLVGFEPRKKVFHFNPGYLLALLRSMVVLGVIGRERVHYWRLFFWSLFRKPRLFSLAILFSIYGFHFRKVSTETFPAKAVSS
ncbi:MAG: DUF4070 domain-containing protein [Bacteroidetes bacterium]|nr:DUF4070 domain-containing protein [Bacteroidota bacterium]